MVVPQGHLVLVGMTGVGKTTVGRAIASRLHRPFVDTDAAIESRSGRDVRTIFAEDGEPAFREIEASVLADALAAEEPSVIAAAGGVVLAAVNRAALQDRGARVVWLCADQTLLVERVRGGGHRPLLDDDPAASLQRMYAARAPLYQQVADAVVRVDGRSIDEVAEAVLR